MDRRAFLKGGLSAISVAGLGAVFTLAAQSPPSPTPPPDATSTAVPTRVATRTPLPRPESRLALSPVPSPSPSGAPSWVYQPGGWLDGWHEGLAKAEREPVWLTVFGDAVAAGADATDYATHGWVGRLSAALVSRYGAWAEFWAPSASRDLAPGYAGSPPFVVGPSTPHAWWTWGYGRVPVFQRSGEGVLQALTPATRRLDLAYLDTVRASWQVRVDGGAPRTVACTGGSVVRRLTLDGLAVQPHRLTFDTGPDPQALVLQGFTSYGAKEAGIGIARLAAPGVSAVDYLTTKGEPTDLFGLWSRNQGFPTAPHLAVIALGINDCQTGVPVERFGEAIERLVGALRQARADTSVLLVANAAPVEGMSQPFRNAERWPVYVARMRAAAEGLHCGLLDIGARWGTAALPSRYLVPTRPEPTDAGHADIAAAAGLLLV